MKVSRKHIIAAIEVSDSETGGELLFYPKYAIKAYPYIGKDERIGEFGWTISVIPNPKEQ